jgi:hypothetical protein
MAEAAKGFARTSLNRGAVEHSMPVGTLVLVQEAARELGADADAPLRSVGVDPSVLRFAMTPVSLRIAGRALLHARHLTRCDHFPVLAGARARFGNAGLVPLLVMQERFVRDAIVDLTRFLRIWFRGVHLSLEVENGWARFVQHVLRSRDEPASADDHRWRLEGQQGAVGAGKAPGREAISEGIRCARALQPEPDSDRIFGRRT